MATRSPPRAVWRFMWRMHRLTWNLSGGRLGRKVGGMPVLQLVTTGHRTGRARSVLVAYVSTPEGPALAATNAGAERDPSWVQNLGADPEARVREAGEWRELRARFLEGPEYETVWQQFVEAESSYPEFREKVDRRVPLVVLEDRGP